MLQKDSENNIIISKNKHFVSTILMIIYILIAMIIAVAVKFSMPAQDKNVSIAYNKGEEAFLSGKYDVAISEYTTLQEKDPWPIWNLKISEIYSIQGDYKKSNELIQKVYDTRNRIIDTENTNTEEFLEKDKELINGIVFNLFINGEYKKSLEYGELFLQSYPDDTNLLKTMFGVYIANNYKEKAKSIINNFSAEENDIDMLITSAKMNLLMGNYNEGLKLLESAYKLDENNTEIFNAIESASVYNENKMVNSLKKLINEEKSNSVYKLFLAKIYSMNSSDISKCEEIIDGLKDDFSHNINYLFTKMNMYIQQDDKDDAEDILDEIIDSEEGKFLGEYAQSLKYYYNEKYDDALKHAKNSVLLNRDYSKTYSSLIPSILLRQKKSLEEEPYLRTALYKDPFDFSTIITTSEYYKDVLKDSSKSLYYYTLATKINPDNAETYYRMALIQNNNQRIDESVDLLKKSISLNDDESKYHRTLGAIYLQENKYEEGITQIRKAYNIDKNDIAALNNAAYYYIYGERDINRAMANIKSAYEGIKETTSSSEKEIITDNYNRIKVLYDSSRDSGVVSEVKLIY